MQGFYAYVYRDLGCTSIHCTVSDQHALLYMDLKVTS